MGLTEDLLAKFARLKAEAEARNAAIIAGREPETLTDAEVARGHPKVSVSTDFQGVRYEARLGTWFGWFWLVFTCFHCVALFYGMSQGSVELNGRTVAQPEWWHFALLALFYVPFFLVGFAFTLARYRVSLADDLITVRWRVLPWVGWTWTLPVGDDVAVTLAFRGSRENEKPVESVVIASRGKELHFGAFLPADVKDFLAGAIRHHYAGEETPFIPSV
jgi:hypothetical protein